MPRRKKPRGRPSVPMPKIPDTFENILKAVLRPVEATKGQEKGR